MNVHDDIQRLAPAYWVGRLDPDLARAVDEHGGTCEDCAGILVATAPAPRFPALRRITRLLLGTAAAAGLVLLGSVFQDSVAPQAIAENAIVGTSRSPHELVLEPPAFLSAEPLSGNRVRGRVGGGGMGMAKEAPDPTILFLQDAKLVRHAALRLRVDSFDAALDRISALVTESAGFLSGAETTRQANGKMHGAIVLRVPPERFDPLLVQLRTLGIVEHQGLLTRDVTKAYRDLEARLAAKRTLLERLKKLLSAAPGEVKDLLEVEVQVGRTLEEIEMLQGELRYHDHQVGFATIEVDLSEKDLARPVEIVETVEAALALAVRDVEAAFREAQKIVQEAGGTAADARLSLGEAGRVQATLKARVAADRFPSLRESLLKLGLALNDTVERRRSSANELPGATLRTETAALDLTLSVLPARVARETTLWIESGDVNASLSRARDLAGEAGGSLLGGTLSSGNSDASATLKMVVDEEKAEALLAKLGALGRRVSGTTRLSAPSRPGQAFREQVQIDLTLALPVAPVVQDGILAASAKSAWKGGVGGLLWSLERLAVGLMVALPWLALALAARALWRRLRPTPSAP